MKRKARIVPIVAIIAVSAVGSALAADVPKEGTFDYTSCFSGESKLISFSNTYSAYSYEMIGTNRSNQPGSIFDKRTFRCVGMNTSFAGRVTANTVCEAVDSDGYKTLSYYSRGSDGKETREIVLGTGKFDGMVRSGVKVEPLGPFPIIKAGTFQNCSRETGTYKLK